MRFLGQFKYYISIKLNQMDIVYKIQQRAYNFCNLNCKGFVITKKCIFIRWD